MALWEEIGCTRSSTARWPVTGHIGGWTATYLK
jgi:hypothetical protein